MLQLKKTIMDTGNPVRPSIELITDDISYPMKYLPTPGFSIYGKTDSESDPNHSKFRHFEPEINFTSKFAPALNYKTTKIKQGWINSDKTYFTPNVDGQGGYFMVFSHNTKNNMFHDDWEQLLVYTPTNSSSSNAIYKISSSISLPNKTDFTLEILPENRNGSQNFTNPPSGVTLTNGVYNPISSSNFYYTHPSKILFKRINERFSIFKFRIGIQITGAITQPAYSVNSNYYTSAFRITISKSNLYSIIPNISYNRLRYESGNPTNFILPSQDTFSNIRAYQDFEDGYWMIGTIYSNNNQVTGTSSYTLNPNNPGYIHPSPSFYKYQNNTKSYPLLPTQYVYYNPPPSNSFFLTNNFNIQWTIQQDDNNIYIIIITPEIIPLFNLSGDTKFLPNNNSAPIRTIYFTGESILDILDLKTSLTDSGSDSDSDPGSDPTE
jgi:hypothetical protein